VRAASTALAAVALAALWGCRASDERAPRDFERMRVQQRYEAHRRSGVFGDGATSQLPPPGTVALEERADSGVAPGTGPATTSELARGKSLYGVYCGVCHGPAGFGGSVVAENMGPPHPPSLRSAALIGLPADTVYAVATHGYGRMPGYAAQLSVTDRWAVVAYVEQLRRTPATTEEAIEDSLRAREIARVDSIALADRAGHE
jgi:mono/diheme cytochrome c family protein